MKKRIHLRKKYTLRFKSKKSNTNIIILLICLIAISVMLLFNYINKKVAPILLTYGEMEAKKFATLIISKSISTEMADDLSVENLFIMSKSDSGEIRTIDFNPITVNKLLLDVTTTVQINLRHLENGDIDKLSFSSSVLDGYNKEDLKKGVFCNVPSGVVFGNSILANLGPKIPIRFKIMGDIVANVESKVTNYGINNALIEVQINMKLNEKVLLPVASSLILVEVNIPISLKIVQGMVPEYYFNGFSKSSSSVTIPIE